MGSRITGAGLGLGWLSDGEWMDERTKWYCEVEVRYKGRWYTLAK